MNASWMQEPHWHRRPLWVGGLIAPWTPMIAIWLFAVAATLVHGNVEGTHPVQSAFNMLILMFIVGSPATFAATWLLGMPAACLLRRYRRLNWVTMCGVSVVAGVAVIYVVQHLFMRPDRDQTFFEAIRSYMFGASLGLVAGITFCLAVGLSFRRPAYVVLSDN